MSIIKQIACSDCTIGLCLKEIYASYKNKVDIICLIKECPRNKENKK